MIFTFIVRYAKKVGLDCIALTDHNTVRGIREAKKEGKRLGILVIPGVELTQKYGKKFWEQRHIIALGVEEEPPQNLMRKSLCEIFDWIEERNGVIYACHPYSFYGLKREIKNERVKVVEVHNSNCTPFTNLRAKISARKLGKAQAAGSDSHSIETLGSVINEIEGEKLDDLLENLRKGRNRIEKAKNANISQIKRLEIERYKRNLNKAYEYINNELPEVLDSYGIPFLSHALRAFALELLFSSIEGKLRTKLFWNSIILAIYAEDFTYNFFGVLGDLIFY